MRFKLAKKIANLILYLIFLFFLEHFFTKDSLQERERKRD